MPISPAVFPGVASAARGLRLGVDAPRDAYPRYPKPPPTAVWSSGFENQIAPYTVAGPANALCDGVVGTPGAATDQKRTGAASFKFAPALSQQYITINVAGSPNVVVWRGYFMMQANPTGAACRVFGGVPGLQNFYINVSTGGVIQAIIVTGTAAGSQVMNFNQWYRIDARFDGSRNPSVIDWMIDGVAQPQATLAQAATTFSAATIGHSTASSTATCWVDDAILSATSSDYPIGAGYSKIYVPTGKGTHVPGAGAFQDQTAAAITDAGDSTTQSWLDIDEVPPSVTDYVTQTASAPTGYLEYDLGQSAEGNQPNSVVVNFAAAAASTASSCDITAKTVDGATVTTGQVISTAVTTPVYSREVLPKIPSTGLAWNESAFNNLFVRVGYGSDVAPNPRVAAVWAEVDYAGVVSTSVATTQNITDTAVTQTDALQTTAVRVVTDTGATPTDSLATIRVRVITDTGVTQSDAAGRGFPRALTDTGVSQTDSVATARRRVVADTGVTQTDSVVRVVRRLISDTGVTNTDTVATRRVRVVVDDAFTEVFPGSSTFPGATLFPGGTFSDTVATIRRRVLTDTGVTQTDAVATTRRRIVTDTGVTQTDSVSRAFPRPVTDTGVTQTDTVATTRRRVIADTGVAQSDTLATTRVRPLADTAATVTDSVATTRRRVITDTGVSQSDSVVATHGGVTGVTDTGVTQSDTVATTRTRPLSDTGATITDSVATTRRRILSDTGLAQSDSVSSTRGALRAVTDTGLSQTDSVTSTAVHPRNITDTGATVSDAVTSTRRRVVTDTGATIVDSVTTTRVRFITDTGVSQSDTVTPATVRPRFITDTGATITDSVVRTASSTHTYRSFTGYATQTEWTGTAAQTGWTTTPTRTYATSTAAQNDLTGVPSQTGIVGAVAL